MDKEMKKGMPTPQERPDIYDDYDYTKRPEGESTGIATPDYIQKLIDARAAKQPAHDGQKD